MRIIKFRGLSLKNEWSYGLLSYTENKNVACGDTGWFISNRAGSPFAYQIRPETRSQFTGLKDKNGKEIYEGDILKHALWGNSEVFWDKEGACFRGENNEHDITLADHQLKRSKVIGNIYENPELLN